MLLRDRQNIEDEKAAVANC